MAEGSSPKKSKRTADRQISRDDNLEEDGEGGSMSGTFQRASEEVLKKRRIVKPRGRPLPVALNAQAPAAPANPFQTVVLPPSKPQEEGSKEDTVNGGSAPAPSHENQSPAAAEPVSISAEALSPEATPSPGKPENVADAEKAAAATGEPSGPKLSEEGKVEGGEKGSERQSASVLSPASAIEKQNCDAGGKNEKEENGIDGSVKKMETPVAFGASVGSGGVVSFATLGAGGGGSGSGGVFQSLMKGGSLGSPSGVPPTFGGFGSTAAAADSSSPLTKTVAFSGTSLGSGGGDSTPGGEGSGDGSKSAKPALPFGTALSSGAVGGGFATFTSFKTASPAGSFWGSLASKGGTEAGEKTGAGEGAAPKDVSTKPSLELMDPSEVVNGEESEECTHRSRAKLFRLDKKEWVEMGIGNMKVLRPVARDDGAAAAAAGTTAEGGKGEAGGDGSGSGDSSQQEKKGTAATATPRLVMRREAGQQVMLNILLQEQTRCSTQGDKALMISCFTPDGPMTYLLKVKTSDDARCLKAAIDVLLPSTP